jgi:hypothetical protein
VLVSASAAAKARVESFMMCFLMDKPKNKTKKKITEAYLCSALPDTSDYEVRVYFVIY